MRSPSSPWVGEPDRLKVAEVPDRSAIVYSATYSDREGTFSSTCHCAIADRRKGEPTDRGSLRDLSGHRVASGGYVLMPNVLGADAARLALRVLNGESPSHSPSKLVEAVRPVFNWKQMQRWGVT